MLLSPAARELCVWASRLRAWPPGRRDSVSRGLSAWARARGARWPRAGLRGRRLWADRLRSLLSADRLCIFCSHLYDSRPTKYFPRVTVPHRCPGWRSGFPCGDAPGLCPGGVCHCCLCLPKLPPGSPQRGGADGQGPRLQQAAGELSVRGPAGNQPTSERVQHRAFVFTRQAPCLLCFHTTVSRFHLVLP